MQDIIATYGWWIGQTISFLAMGLAIISLQCKQMHRYFAMQTVASILFLTSFLFLGGNAGVYLNIYSLGRSLFFFLLGKRALNRALQAALLAFLVLCGIPAFLGDGWIALLPFFGQLAGTVGMSSRNGQILRVMQFCLSSPLWLAYNLLKMSWGGIGCEVFNMVSVVVSVLRYGWRALAGDGDGEPKQDRSTANVDPVCEKQGDTV